MINQDKPKLAQHAGKGTRIEEHQINSIDKV